MKSIILSLAMVFAASASYASDFDVLEQQKQRQTGLSFEDIKQACLNPGQYHNQISPNDIQISCKDVQYKWIRDVDGALSLANSRVITTGLVCDKYEVGSIQGRVVASPQIVACPSYRQIKETINTVRSVTCKDVVKHNSSAVDFCAGVVNDMKTVNPKAVKVEDTGKVYQFCGLDTKQQNPYVDQDGLVQSELDY